jgi:nitroreductase
MSNPFIQMIKERRSVRSYDEKPIKKEILEEIIQAGKYAPSAMNKQPWKFIVITDKKVINDLSNRVRKELQKILKKRFISQFKFKELKDEQLLHHVAAFAFSEKDIIFFGAPALVFILTTDSLFFNESCACCAENMMLAAHSLGVGSCWIGFASVLGMNKNIMDSIGIPEDYLIAAAIVFGYPKGSIGRASIRKVESDVINWIG